MRESSRTTAKSPLHFPPPQDEGINEHVVTNAIEGRHNVPARHGQGQSPLRGDEKKSRIRPMMSSQLRPGLNPKVLTREGLWRVPVQVAGHAADSREKGGPTALMHHFWRVGSKPMNRRWSTILFTPSLGMPTNESLFQKSETTEGPQ